MRTLLYYFAAALAEIVGCFAFWTALRNGRSPAVWLPAGLAALAVFAWLLTRSELAYAGRAYAAYGGIYIGCALLWLWAVEGQFPDRWDLIGTGLCMLGAMIILIGPHRAS